MDTINIKNTKHCLNCRFWLNELRPKLNMPGLFEVDASQKKVCLKTHFERNWNFVCDKWAIKVELE